MYLRGCFVGKQWSVPPSGKVIGLMWAVRRSTPGSTHVTTSTEIHQFTTVLVSIYADALPGADSIHRGHHWPADYGKPFQGLQIRELWPNDSGGVLSRGLRAGAVFD